MPWWMEAGARDNDGFEVVGDQLKLNLSPDFEEQTQYLIRLRSTDSGGGFVETTQRLTVISDGIQDAVISITATAVAVEPNVNGAFTVSASRPVSEDTTIAYSISGLSTATSGVDYEILNGEVTILANTDSVVKDVIVRDDDDVEGPRDHPHHSGRHCFR